MKQPEPCPLCQRQTHLSFHHFIPRKVHRRAHFKKHFSKDELQQGAHLCRQCHSGIHKFYDEMTLAKRFNSLALIKADPALANHFAWVARQRVR
ncbi:MAG: hypothetical protein AAF431_12305 [Pseudomonadota bacterium]